MNLDQQPTASEALLTVARTLERIAIAMEKPGQAESLGFVQSPRPVRIYANRTNGDTWYTLNRERQTEPCPSSSLCGYLTGLEFVEVERRGKPVWKMQLTLKADRTYVIESGSDSVFSKCVLAVLARTPAAELANPITLESYPADNDESLFCNVYLNGARIKAPWNAETDWRSTAQAAKSAVDALSPE